MSIITTIHDLNLMFKRIINKYSGFNDEHHTLKILSGPNDAESPGPWMLMFDNFVMVQGCHRLIELGHKIEYERSTGVGGENVDETTKKNKI